MLQKKNSFGFNHADQQDDLYTAMTTNEIKEAFDSRGVELKDHINSVIDTLESTIEGDSGADNIGASTIAGVTGNTVQAQTKNLKEQIDALVTKTAELEQTDSNLSQTDSDLENMIIDSDTRIGAAEQNITTLQTGKTDKSLFDTEIAGLKTTTTTLQNNKADKTEVQAVQSQVDRLVVDGDSSPAIAQALAGSEFTTLKQKLDSTDELLAEIAINVKSFGAKGDGTTDDSAAIQNAINHLGSIGGGTLLIPDGTFLITATNPTVSAPKRIEIRSDNIHIIGNGKIKMSGITKAYLDSIDDVSSSGRDVFTAFSFLGVKHCSVTGIQFEGEWDGVGTFRYASPRAKAIGFIGCEDCQVTGIHAEGILGNAVNSVNSQSAVDGFYAISKRIKIRNSTAIRCLENGFNYMGGNEDCDFSHNTALLCGSTGFESASNGLVCIGNTVKQNKHAGMAFSGKNEQIKHNIVMDNGDGVNEGNGINLTFANDVTTGDKIVSGNIINDNDGFGIYVYPGNKDVDILDNTFKNNNNSPKTETFKSIIYAVGTVDKKIERVNIKNNKFFDNVGKVLYGINLSYVDRVDVKTNTVVLGTGNFVYAAGTSANGVVEANYSNVTSIVSQSASNFYLKNIERSGTLSVNGTGNLNPLYIPHGLGVQPKDYNVQAASVDAGNAVVKYVLTDATQLIVYFANAPVVGTNNITLRWRASA